MAELSVVVTKQLNDIIGKAEAEAEVTVREFIEDVYRGITDFETSPKITGYYMTNHRIQFRSAGGQFATGGGVKLNPTVKDSEEPGVYFGNLQPTISEELGKLDNFKLGMIVTITTAVPYAAEVEQKYGVYDTGQALAGAQARRLEI